MKSRLCMAAGLAMVLCLAAAIAAKPMRTVTLIVVHCSATPEGQDFHASDIDRWHRARGWKMIGYHYVVNLNGTIEQGRPEPMVGAHCQGHNEHSIGVCYIGGLDSRGHPADTRTPEQKKALRHLLESLHAAYPKAFIVGHHDLNPAKACPCMDVVKEYADLQGKQSN